MGLKHILKLSALALSYLVVMGITVPSVEAQQRTDLPTIGTAAGGTMSLDRERLMGDFYMRQVRAQAPLVQDPALREYLDEIGNRLVLHSGNARFPFNFFWVRDNNLNAFAFLGGHVGIHTGLILQAETESELASVVAHEIAHVTQRHIARNMERLDATAGLTLAQVVGGVLLGLANPQLGMAVLTGSMAGMQQRQINYTRQFEIEADRFGMTSLARAGFDPHGAPAFFSRLAAEYRYATQMPQYLITHPLPESRIADTRSRADSLGRHELEPSLGFELAKTRIKVRFSNMSPRDALTEMESRERRADHEHKKAAARYGQALALFELNRLNEADAIIRDLHDNDPLNLFYIDTITDVWLQLEQYDETIDFLTEAYVRRPNNQVITLNLAHAATAAGNYDFAIKLLDEYLLRKRDDPLAYDLLKEAHQRAGNSVSMHEAHAEALALYGNFTRAIEELHTAFSKVEEGRTLRRQRIQGRIEQMRALSNERERVMQR
ncbi:beta-barrel assembly-enhancing protease [Aliidiomarina sp. Khilg15.8]